MESKEALCSLLSLGKKEQAMTRSENASPEEKRREAHGVLIVEAHPMDGAVLSAPHERAFFAAATPDPPILLKLERVEAAEMPGVVQGHA